MRETQIVGFSKWRHSRHQTLDLENTIVSQNGGDFSTIFRTSTGHKKYRGFDQIKKFFRRNNHQSMKIFFTEKNFLVLGAL